MTKIKNLGVLHIETKEQEPTEELQDLYRLSGDVGRTVKQLKDIDKSSEELEGDIPRFESGKEVLEKVRNIESQIEQKQQHKNNLEKEAHQLEPWGDFSYELVQKLKEKGVWVRFHVCRQKMYNPQWEDDYYIQVISDHAGFRYFAIIEQRYHKPEDIIDLPGVDELHLPKRSLSSIREEQKKLNREIELLEHELALIARYSLNKLEEYLLELKREIDENNAIHQTTGEVEEHVMHISGWVPQPKVQNLNNFLDQEGILYIADQPSEEEKVPVLLKNNRFARLFEPIGDLYELPNHKELDLVPFFAPFYMMFFGFSLGDAGYGLLILLTAFFLKPKFPHMKRILSLAQWLGGATVLFGALTGTFFGIDLIQSDIPWLSGVREYMVDTDSMFNLALILGAIQIIFGMVLKIINISMFKGFSYAYSTVGWLLLIIGSTITVLLRQSGAIEDTTGGYIQNGVLIGSGALILLFNDPKRHIVMNFLNGLWDVYSMVTGLVGDLLSYIRLFALGVSSAILGFVFNELAMSLSPDNIIFGPLVMIIILLIGHSMTLFMAGLGAFVHPIRLTFVEFYKNAGFTGGGKRYTPFAEQREK
ncbi:V-type ATPase 116kDa subunit family protein [Marinilabiliaceae bacterium ANBcel2]|nr:V-type ATPase 116kDa subunit family protein [Marinilabiliaceae bacterium ANBcel2]